MSARSELGESPAVVERLLQDAAGPIATLAADIRRRGIRTVVIAARGTSDHAALYAQYVLGARNGLLVAPATPSLVSLYGTGPDLRDTLVLGISQSGRSPDVVSVVAEGRRQGALTAALTNDPQAPLAAAAERVIGLDAGPELAVAATKTYVAEVALLAMLSAALSGDAGSGAELAALPAAMRTALALEPAVAALAPEFAPHPDCIVLARGFQYATAREWALKLKELAGVLADPYSAADFQHGPISLVRAGFPVLAVATAGPAIEGMAELLGRLRAEGARLLILSDAPEAVGAADTVPLPRVPEWLSPLVAILPAQLYAYHLTLARGLDPDAPRNLSKVTLTL